MNNIVVEVLDPLDKESSEPWSLFGFYENLEKFHEEWDVFVQYCKEHSIIQVRIIKQ